MKNLFILVGDLSDIVILDYLVFRLGANGGPKIVAEALAEIDDHFRAISSLQEIIVEAYRDGISDSTRM